LIGPGVTSSPVDFFSVTLDSTIGPGSYPVDFTFLATGIFGEQRETTGEVTVMVTPEPPTMWLAATALLMFVITFPRVSLKKSEPGCENSFP